MIVAALAALPMCASADVYRCVGPDGKTLYGDSPCPSGAAEKANITTAVGACTTVECETKRQQETNDARDRLRAQKEELAELADKRRRSEIETERAMLEELRWRQSVDGKLATAADDAAYPLYYPTYPYGPGIRPCGQHCMKVRPRPPHAHQPLPRPERGVRLRLDR